MNQKHGTRTMERLLIVNVKLVPVPRSVVLIQTNRGWSLEYGSVSDVEHGFAASGIFHRSIPCLYSNKSVSNITTIFGTIPVEGYKLVLV